MQDASIYVAHSQVKKIDEQSLVKRYFVLSILLMLGRQIVLAEEVVGPALTWFSRAAERA